MNTMSSFNTNTNTNSSYGNTFNTGNTTQSFQKKTPNPSNYKIVKCKNFEKGKKYSF
jgi:hypothetical protein